MRNRSHFQRGSGVFTCDACGRRARVVDQSNDQICQQCWDLAGLDNSVNDGAMTLAEAATERDDLFATCVARGGDPEKIKRDNSFLWPVQGEQ